MHNIDLKTVLKRKVSEGYDDLVTRHTGRAVRSGVEELLAELDRDQVTVMDFSAVGCLDISCADEIVGKLLLDHGRARLMLLRGLTPAHCDAIVTVLERHSIAVVAQDGDGGFELLGPIEPTVRDVFTAIWQHRWTALPDIAARTAVPAHLVQRALAELIDRQLVRQEAGHYLAPVAR